MMWDKVTTMENLAANSCSINGGVLEYENYVLVCGLTYRGFEAAIYSISAENRESFDCESEISLYKVCSEVFERNGDAMKWCYDNVKKSE